MPIILIEGFYYEATLRLHVRGKESFVYSCRKTILSNYFVFGTGCLRFGSLEDLCKSLMCTQGKVNKGGGGSGVLDSLSPDVSLCCEEAGRKTGRVLSKR